MVCLSVNVSYLNIIYLSLSDVRDSLRRRNCSEDNPGFSGNLGLNLGESKSFFKALLFGKEKLVLLPTPIYSRFPNDHITPVCDTGGRQPTFSCFTDLASTREGYPFIQDLREDAGYSENIIFSHSKAVFIFRKFAEWNENVSI